MGRPRGVGRTKRVMGVKVTVQRACQSQLAPRKRSGTKPEAAAAPGLSLPKLGPRDWKNLISIISRASAEPLVQSR
jgi:hypothetical protein